MHMCLSVFVYVCIFPNLEREKSNATHLQAHTGAVIRSRSPRTILHLDGLLPKQGISGVKPVIVLL